MSKSRRLAIVMVPSTWLIDSVLGHRRVVVHGVPEGAGIHRIFYDFQTDSFAVTLSHPTFPEVAEGERIRDAAYPGSASANVSQIFLPGAAVRVARPEAEYPDRPLGRVCALYEDDVVFVHIDGRADQNYGLWQLDPTSVLEDVVDTSL